MPELDDQAQTRLAMAALFAALVRALEKRGATPRKEVEAELDKIYHQLRSNPAGPIKSLETLKWANELLNSP
jgi:hypothetical protein